MSDIDRLADDGCPHARPDLPECVSWPTCEWPIDHVRIFQELREASGGVWDNVDAVEYVRRMREDDAPDVGPLLPPEVGEALQRIIRQPPTPPPDGSVPATITYEEFLRRAAGTDSDCEG